MDCSDRIYHQNDLGFTRKCACQDAVHLNFGNISLLLSRKQVGDFSTYITEAMVSEFDAAINPDERCIYVPTRDPCLMFAMTYNDLKGLHDLLDQTLLMLEVEDALE